LKARAGQPKEKKKYVIPKISNKRAAKQAQEKEARGDNDTLKQKWFKARRKEMVGICQCGCAEKSSKHDDQYFHCSICHIFPQRYFSSIMYHPLNWVERKFWQGCHTNMDEQSMDKWPGMADWDDIVEKFHQLVPLLTDEERSTKFYAHLEKLVYSN
jgi:hypothetical protein